MNMFASPPSFWRDRLQASALHLALSVSIAALAALLVFGIWYPYPYREISGGRELFMLVVSVDVILGPVITLAIFNRTKPWRELRRDLAMVGALQIAALMYGLWTVCVARPVHLVFETDRFRVVHAIDLEDSELAKATPELRALPFSGPTVLGLRGYKSDQEKSDALFAAVMGVDVASRPEFWQPYAQSIPQILKAAKPVAELKKRFPDQNAVIDEVLSKAGYTRGNALFLPVVSHQLFWTVLLDDSDARILGFLPVDSF
jgi:hypothetical protein